MCNQDLQRKADQMIMDMIDGNSKLYSLISIEQSTSEYSFERQKEIQNMINYNVSVITEYLKICK